MLIPASAIDPPRRLRRPRHRSAIARPRSTDEADHARSDPQRRPHLPRWRRQDEPRRGDALRRRRDLSDSAPSRRARRRSTGIPTSRSAARASTWRSARSSTTASRITLVDTPGYADFQADVVEALAAVDAAIVVIDASAGVEVGTEEVWRLADARGLPRMVFINKMDRENANYDAALDQLKARFGPKIAPVYLPIGSRGVVPRLRRRDRGARQRSTRAARRRRSRSPTSSRASSTRAATRWSRPPPRRATS